MQCYECPFLVSCWAGKLCHLNPNLDLYFCTLCGRVEIGFYLKDGCSFDLSFYCEKRSKISDKYNAIAESESGNERYGVTAEDPLFAGVLGRGRKAPHIHIPYSYYVCKHKYTGDGVYCEGGVYYVYHEDVDVWKLDLDNPDARRRFSAILCEDARGCARR